MMATTADNLDVALTLAAQGLFVFPCHSGGEKAKQPMPFLRWKDVSTTDEATIRAWWRKWPDAAPALDLGKCGLIVIDADRHGEADGVDAFGGLMAENGFVPDLAPLVATPNAGNHHFFRQPVDRKLGNGRGALPAGIDVRGAGGYVVAPGSIMADGRNYELWGDLASIPPLPDWLSAILETRKTGGARDEGNHLQSHAAQGFEAVRTRNANQPVSDDEIAELLNCIPADIGYHDWLAVLMAVHAETGGAGFNLVDQWSATGSKYPGAAEMAKKWRSFKSSGVTGRTLAEIARQYGANLSAIAIKYRGTPEFDAVEAAAAADALYAAHLKRERQLAVEAASEAESEVEDEEIGGAVDYFDIPDSLLRPPGLVGEIADWICSTTGEPIRVHAVGAALVAVGSLIARKVYSRTRPTGAHLYIGALAPSGVGKDHPQSCLKAILTHVTGITDPQFIGWAGSAPKLGSKLLDRAAAVMIADEFSDKFVAIRGRNASTSTAAISEAFRELWGRSIGSYEVPTALTRSDTIIHRPALSFYGATTVVSFKKSLVEGDIVNGLYNRFLFLPRYAEVESGAEMDGMPEIPERLAQRCSWLYNCLEPFQVSLAIRGDGYPADPIMVPFSEEAAAMNDENRLKQKSMQRLADEDAPLALYGRYAEQIKRIAMIVACGRHPDMVGNAIIQGSDMIFARELVGWSISQSVLMARRDMVENWMQGQHNLVLGIIRKAKTISRSKLYRIVRGRMKARDLDEVIKALVEGANIGAIPEETPGRKRIEYRYLRG